MKGLLLKDTYMTVRLCRMFLLLDVVFLGVWMFGNGDLFFLTYPCLLTTMVPMTLISYDDGKNNKIAKCSVDMTGASAADY